jgi:hypothetical protein
MDTHTIETAPVRRGSTHDLLRSMGYRVVYASPAPPLDNIHLPATGPLARATAKAEARRARIGASVQASVGAWFDTRRKLAAF